MLQVGESEGITLHPDSPEDDLAQNLPSQPQLPQPVVEVPLAPSSVISNCGFLPGHFEALYIISEEVSETEGGLIYRVKLKSGEVQKASSDEIQSLKNGRQALSNFLQYGPTESVSPRLSDVSGEDSALSDSKYRTKRRTRRSTRARNSGFAAFFGALSSDDDVAHSRGHSSSEDIIASSGTTTRRRRMSRARKSKSRSEILLSDEESNRSTPVGTRHSTRTRKVLRKNLRERNEDEISENEGTPKHHEKFFGAKEKFHKIPENDPFRERHRGACKRCHVIGDDYAKGPLVFCQGCTSSFHHQCLGPRAARDHLVTKVTDDLFVLQCRNCLGVSHSKDPAVPHQGYCAICNREGNMSRPLRDRLTPKQEQQFRQQNGGKDPITFIDMTRVNNVNNLLFRCTTCHRAFHFEHLSDVAHLTWHCQECASIPGEVGAMVAWRPVDPKAKKAEEANREYLIKWKNQSYSHSTWMPGSWVWGFVNYHMRRAFIKKDLPPQRTIEEAIPEDYLRVDIVFDVRFSSTSPLGESKRSYEADLKRIDNVSQVYVKFKGLPYEDVVWDTPPDRSDVERWEDFEAAFADWVKREYVREPNQSSLRRHLAKQRKKNFQTDLVKDHQPPTMTGGEMMDYQDDGVNWLYYMWFKQQNAILADEMGLGKTIQVIGFMATLIHYHRCWPFLVVVPNSTCPNWRKEIKSWVPSMRVVTYYGSAFSRNLAKEYEMYADDDPTLRCHVVVTSYETMVDDVSRRFLAKIPWAGLIVDEGQRLKNDKSQLYDALSRIRFSFKLLLTGTPLQNNIRELFNLLQFCDPSKKAIDLEEEYGTLSKENIPKLHEMLRPFFLRRTKAQVLTFLPPVAQIIVPVSMSLVQKKLYKSILAKNPQLIKSIFQRSGAKALKQAERHNLNNILMQLRKCLCHPFVYSRAIEERTSDRTKSHRHLVDAAGKLQLLELMLPKLKDRGHRVLIFSQFLENLDIIEDFLDGMGLPHLRLDGRMTSLEKQKTIDDYNAQDSPYFAFLLSTRSGGVGINLATADTVIIMDPDFNPHQDMQALSRAHRIGQANKVLVFQLMTRSSAEEKIMQIGKKKMVLDHVLIDRMVAEEDNGQELESVLRHGAQALFNDDDSGDVRYDSESVDKLLDRSQAEQAKVPIEGDLESQFSFARVWANDNQNLEDRLQEMTEMTEQAAPNTDLWDKILLEREQAAAEEARRKAETLGRGKRKRANVDYGRNAPETSPFEDRILRLEEIDGEYRADDGVDSESESAPELDPEDLRMVPKRTKIQNFQRIAPINLPLAVDGTVESNLAQQQACIACRQVHPVGSCRLQLAGVEHCPLCGLAHYGHSRTCPHLRSDTQVARMLEAIKHSTEDKELIRLAKKYLTGIRGNLAYRKKQEASKAAAGSATPLPANPVATTSSSVIDLTNDNRMASAGQPLMNPAHSFAPHLPTWAPHHPEHGA
ncbi:putative chromatin remodeling complex subunit (Chd3) [Aspergillus saccharolyticus JOP 1030-1]|uniref:Chromatin remodeling complex subunit n=1 Tax=Aspergillus saccharolyticus JOP 1030-1 TaxID=1450539 RepID=A0A319AJG3_9EURO|nr:chromatin remodeling complex subunit [Aspergillus saccharolyticus JOP 1030-1]PYH46782.1 chromatin remodeling complex subunit [Aspergillus saccharolyticus JOP 1030-1]